MELKEHRKIHRELHKNLDLLVADYLSHNDNLPSETTILDLMKWSNKQTKKPDELPITKQKGK